MCAHKWAYPNISLENRDFVTGIARKKTQTVSSLNPPYFVKYDRKKQLFILLRSPKK